MLHLASRSPRRRALLARLGVAFDVIDLEVDEQPSATEDPLVYVQRVAGDKAHAGWHAVHAADPEAVVLGSDTEVVVNGEVFGKPLDPADARRMLGRLAGRTHMVHSAVVLVAEGRSAAAVATTEVTFAPMSSRDIATYVASGEPMGKAGAYAIQGGAERFVERLCGSYSGVMGLPLFETAALLQGFGIALDAAAAGVPVVAPHAVPGAATAA